MIKIKCFIPMVFILAGGYMCICWSNKAYSQELKVNNVRFTIQEHDVAVIHYDLEFDDRDRRYNVNLLLRKRSDPNFAYRPQEVVGDFGKGRFEGENNKIVWSITHEDPDDFFLNPFIDNYYFSIEARRRSRAGWWFLLSVVGGAAAYYYTSY